MREDLKRLGNEKRHTFTGIFVRNGTKSGFKAPLETVLLKDVRHADTDQIVTDHLWFNNTKGFNSLDLVPGDIVQFDARVGQYTRGYFGRREDVYVPVSTDYHLERPTKVRKIDHVEIDDNPQ